MPCAYGLHYHVCRYVSEYNDTQTSSSASAVGELDGNRMWNDSRLDSAAQELLNRFPAAVSVVQRPVIYIHPDKGVGIVPLESPGIAHGVVKRICTVGETVGDAVSQVPGNLPLESTIEIFANDISAEGQRQARLSKPPFAHIGDEVKAL